MRNDATLERIVFFGRTGHEALEMLGLAAESLRGRSVLDCPGGPGSLVAHLAPIAARAVAVDPLYALGPEATEATARADIEEGLRLVRDNPETFPEIDLAAFSRARLDALTAFLADRTRAPERYVAAALPDLPFADRSFDVVVSGNLLFVYSDAEDGGFLAEGGLDRDFHAASIAELARVAADEVRVYPTATVGVRRTAHPYLADARAVLHGMGWTTRLAPVGYVQGSSAANDVLIATRS